MLHVEGTCVHDLFECSDSFFVSLELLKSCTIVDIVERIVFDVVRRIEETITKLNCVLVLLKVYIVQERETVERTMTWELLVTEAWNLQWLIILLLEEESTCIVCQLVVLHLVEIYLWVIFYCGICSACLWLNLSSNKVNRIRWVNRTELLKLCNRTVWVCLCVDLSIATIAFWILWVQCCCILKPAWSCTTVILHYTDVTLEYIACSAVLVCLDSKVSVLVGIVKFLCIEICATDTCNSLCILLYSFEHCINLLVFVFSSRLDNLSSLFYCWSCILSHSWNTDDCHHCSDNNVFSCFHNLQILLLLLILITVLFGLSNILTYYNWFCCISLRILTKYVRFFIFLKGNWAKSFIP